MDGWLSKIHNLLLDSGVFYLSGIGHPGNDFLILKPSSGGKEMMLTYFHNPLDVIDQLAKLDFDLLYDHVNEPNKDSIYEYVIIVRKRLL